MDINNKIYINCKFNEKDEVKELGAKWDSDYKKWYFIGIENSNIFSKWKLTKNKDYYKGNIVNNKDFNKLPDLNNLFYENIKEEYNKYYIKIRDNEVTILEFDKYCNHVEYTLEESWQLYIEWGNCSIQEYIEDKKYYSKYRNRLIYLGQFKKIEECREYIKKYL